jgi:hypothetical protein
MEFKELYSLFESYLQKNYPYSGLSSFYWYLLHDLTNSRSFNGPLLFSDFCHQAIYIFWAIIVAVDLPYENTLGRIQILVFQIGPTYPLRSVQTPNQARTRFFRFCGVFG